MNSNNVFKKPTKRTVVTCVGLIIAISVGILAGFFLAFELSPKGVDYSGLDEDGYSDDPQKLYESYLSNTKDPMEYSPNDLANISIYKYSLNKYTTSTVTSAAKSLGVTQTTHAKSIKNDTEFFNESISESAFVKVAKRFYQSNDVVDIYDGSIVSDSNGISGEYKEKEEFTVEQYEETWGKNLSQPVIYIISSKTTLETSSITASDNGYTISLDLDPLTSVIRYSKQMIQMSSLSNAPEFTKVHVEFEVDKDLNLLEMNVSEAYYVWVVGKNFTEATLNEKYTILDSAPEIPTIDEKVYF